MSDAVRAGLTWRRGEQDGVRTVQCQRWAGAGGGGQGTLHFLALFVRI